MEIKLTEKEVAALTELATVKGLTPEEFAANLISSSVNGWSKLWELYREISKEHGNNNQMSLGEYYKAVQCGEFVKEQIK